MRVLLLLVLFISTITISQAQPCIDPPTKIYDQWYFGFQGGFDFSNGAPTVNTSSMIDATAGTTSIANSNGKTLFYSNGINVWDKNNNLMPTGTGLSGNLGYTQNSLSFPFPNDYSKYYLFTNGTSGLAYSVIDTTLNGGSGDITTKDVNLFANTTQKLSGVADDNGNVWVVTTEFNTNKFLAYKVDASGVSTTPVISNAGIVQTVKPGSLRFSQDGTKLAISLGWPQNIVEVYDFDKTTGLISNPITINVSLAYDTEFSTDGTKLYTVSQNGNEVNQFDLSSGNSTTINASKTVLSSVSSTYYNSIKLGPDGKIYVGLGKIADGFISVIDNPNGLGLASNYQHKLITMEAGTSAQNGFPNTVANLSSAAIITAQDTCLNQSTQFNGRAYGDPSTWTWDFNDPAPGISTATGANPTHTFSNTGTYAVTLTYPNACGTTTTITKNVTINATPTVTLNDVLVCDTPYVMDALHPGATYLWSTGKTTQTISVSAGGKYWVRVTENGCSGADTATFSVWGQGNKGDYNWLFGNKAGVNFANNPPTVIPTNSDNTQSSSSSISDPLGKLLFYSDGVNVYDKNNNLMANGTGLNGNTNPGQSTLIIPHPAANNFYYLFAISPTGDFNYSVVDLSYNNGLGQVTQKNISLSTPVADKLTGVNDDNGNFWVIAHGLNNNQFIAYKIDKKGLSSTPVTSSVGAIQTDGNGYMKFSKDGTKAAVAIKGQNIVEVYDFDKNTGQFSNPVTITNATTPYGVEFAPDNSYLYVSTDGSGSILQYHLSSTNSAAVMASKTVITSDPTQTYESMQLGPDGRIWISHGNGTTSVSVINNPFDSLNVDYQNKIFNLGKASNGAFPNFVANYFSNSSWGIMDADTCFGMTTLFQGSAPDSVRSWTWDFGDGTPTVSGQTASHQYASTGTYNVKLRAIYHCGDTTMNKTVTILASPVLTLKDTTLCTATSYTLNALNPGSTYLWSNGSSGQTLTVNTNGTYSVMVSKGGCAISSTANVSFAHAGSFSLGNDTTLCAGTTVTIDPGAFPGGTYQWSTSATTQTINVNTSGNYALDITLSGCTIHDDININFITPPTVSLGADFALCQGTSKKIGSFNSGATYIWSNNFVTDSINVSSAGKYWLRVTKGGGCVVSDTVVATVTAPPTVSLGADQSYCSGSPVTLDAGNAGLTYQWSTGASSQTISVSTTGNYSVKVINGPCTVQDDININLIPPPTVSLGADLALCQGTSQMLNATNSGFNYLWSNNAATSQINVNSSGTYWVHVFQGKCLVGDTINITFQNGPAVRLPNEIIICTDNGDTTTLDGGLANSYLWSPGGSTSRSIVANAAGTYTLTASDALGCKTIVSSNILDICEARIYVPTIFSPNGDGRNDDFKISYSNVKTFELEIFNRWGELIFVSKDINISWDGKYRNQIVEEGAYIWKITFSGETSRGIETHTKTGDVTVIK